MKLINFAKFGLTQKQVKEIKALFFVYLVYGVMIEILLLCLQVLLHHEIDVKTIPAGIIAFALLAFFIFEEFPAWLEECRGR